MKLMKSKYHQDYFHHKLNQFCNVILVKEASNNNTLCVLDNSKALDISQLSGLIKDSLIVVTNDTGPAHITSHLGSKGITLFASNITLFKVSIEKRNFKVIQLSELSKLSAEKILKNSKKSKIKILFIYSKKYFGNDNPFLL